MNYNPDLEGLSEEDLKFALGVAGMMGQQANQLTGLLDNDKSEWIRPTQPNLHQMASEFSEAVKSGGVKKEQETINAPVPISNMIPMPQDALPVRDIPRIEEPPAGNQSAPQSAPVAPSPITPIIQPMQYEDIPVAEEYHAPVETSVLQDQLITTILEIQKSLKRIEKKIAEKPTKKTVEQNTSK